MVDVGQEHGSAGRLTGVSGDRLGYRPGLDGVRGVAILLVMIAHGFYWTLPGGGVMGVHLFYALSGYLITALLLEELGNCGRISLRRFYARRALRLLPALFVFLAVWTIVALLRSESLAPAGWSLVYVANWAKTWGHDLGTLGHMWSLAVEEQFYLLWPLVLPLLARWGRRPMLLATVVAIAGSTLLRVFLSGDFIRAYNGTDTVASSILAGCLTAQLRGEFARLRRYAWVGFALFAGFSLWMVTVSNRRFVVVVAVTAAAVAAVPVLLQASEHPPGWLTCRPLRRLGVLAYPLYLWHVPVLMWVQPDVYTDPKPVAAAVGLVASLVLAVGSYRFVESPALRLKTRFAPMAHTDGSGVAQGELLRKPSVNRRPQVSRD